MNLTATFDSYAHQLDTKAAQLQQGTQIIKAGSLLSFTLGCVGLAGTGVGAVPLVVGLGLYGFAALREKSATGRFMPLPWSQASGAIMAAGAIQQDVDIADVPITEYDYLSQDDKADYTLFGVMGPVLVPMLEGATPVQQERWLTQARRSLIKHHADLISDPELMAPALYGSIEGARGAFAANLPDEMQALISPRIIEAASARRDFSDNTVISVEPVIDVVNVQPVVATSTTAYQKIIASPYRSRFFLGGQRTGKSFLAIHCAQAAKAKGADIYYLNLSSWGTEDDGYSSVAMRGCAANIQVMSATHAENVIADARKLLQAFFISDRPSILVLEEWCELGSRNHQHKALLEPLLAYSASIVEQLANTGQKRQKAIYATGPMFVAGSLQQATKAAKSMALVLVAIAPNKTAHWNNQALSFDAAVFSMALANWYGVTDPVGEFDDDRIAFVDGAWLPVGDLPGIAQSAKAVSEPAPVAAAAEVFDAEDDTPAQTEPLLPGFEKSVRDAALSVERYLQKREGEDVLVTTIKQAFRSNQREAVEPHLMTLCMYLATSQAGRFILRRDGEGRDRICYQSAPLMPPK